LRNCRLSIFMVNIDLPSKMSISYRYHEVKVDFPACQ
jgi:hypothetical protein